MGEETEIGAGIEIGAWIEVGEPGAEVFFFLPPDDGVLGFSTLFAFDFFGVVGGLPAALEKLPFDSDCSLSLLTVYPRRPSASAFSIAAFRRE